MMQTGKSTHRLLTGHTAFRSAAILLMLMICLPVISQVKVSKRSEQTTFQAQTTETPTDSLATDSVFCPDSNKALWLSALCPGLGQIYNRSYWKLPIIAAGTVGITYAIRWNDKYYNAYTDAYHDLLDDDPTTNYFEKIVPPSYAGSQLNTLLKNRQQQFRRQRDLCIIIAAGLYLVNMLDAYVDAELFNFDISDDLSFEWGAPSPDFYPGYDNGLFPNGHALSGLGISCCFRF